MAQLGVDADSVSVLADGGSCRSTTADNAIAESHELRAGEARSPGERQRNCRAAGKPYPWS